MDLAESTPPIVARLASEISAVREVESVALVGSRKAGRETTLSDWEFLVVGSAELLDVLPITVQRLEPLARFWDPLIEHAALMVLFSGPIKVDLITDLPNAHPRTRRSIPPDTPADIAAHFWDWTLWLGSKQLAGRDAFVVTELAKMQSALLSALGIETLPTTLREAVVLYQDAIRRAGFATEVDELLGRDVIRALQAQGLV